MAAADILSSLPTLAELARTVDDRPEALFSGSSEVQSAALQAAKFVFDLSVQSENVSKRHLDTLLISISPSEAPQTRSQARKRKRSPPPPTAVAFQTTPIGSLFLDGMDDEQIWSQLDLRTKNICDALDYVVEKESEEDDLEGKPLGEDEDEDEDEDYEEDEDDEEMDEKLREAIRRMEDGEDVDFAELGLDESLKEMLLEGSSGDEDEEGEGGGDGDDGDSDENEDDAEEEVALRDSSSESEDDGPSSFLNVIAPKKSALRKKGSSRSGNEELDDDFFDLTAFNAQTEQVEARTATSGHLGEEDEDDDDISVDFFAPVDTEEQFEEEDMENDPGMLFYKDFFKPPKQAKRVSQSGTVRFRDEVRVRKIKAKGKNLPLSTMYGGDDDDADDDDDDDNDNDKVQGDTWVGIGGGEEDDDSSDDEDEDAEMGELDSEDGDESETIERDAISRVKDDLFAEDEEEEESQKNFSTHEKRMAALREQISEFEAENVGPKDWVLMGEADSRSRPQNSLLEEDLEFERVMKAVPVITEEVVQGLEERIKARILENRFDDVVRIRPLEDKPFLPSRFFELKDTKSTQSLAQIYEDDYVAAQTGGVAGEDRDGKLKKEHEEIEELWESICGKLDALCNAHFTPKQASLFFLQVLGVYSTFVIQPKATISTISNVSTATLESALPTAKAVGTMLAPEEVFAPSSTDLRSRSELTPAEKQSLRRKQRKAKQKTRDALNTSTDKYARAQKGGSLKKQKEDALKSVVKAGKGVTVVGKKKKEILGKDKKSKTASS